MHNFDTHQNKDKVFKESLALFVGKTLDFFDSTLQGLITEILATEVTETTTQKAFADLAFLLSTGRGVHFEMEDDVSLDDILRFAGYNIWLTRMHKIPFLTVILTVNRSKLTGYSTQGHAFNPIIICLKDRDADATLQKLQKKLEKGEPINEIELLYMPLYGSKSGKSMYEILDGAIKLTAKIPQKTTKNKLQSLLLLQTSKFANEKEFIKVLEDNEMILEGNLAVKVLEERGFKKGIAQAATTMLKKGIDAQSIADMLDKPIDWVQDLQNQQNQISQTNG